MSNTDSFIDEVTDELRRDRLYAAFRRYGWIGGVLILAIVGGTAWTQWDKAAREARAEGFGDALTEALDTGSPEARREALAAIEVSGEQIAIRDMLLASDPGEDKAATLAALDKVIADAALAPVWRDLAILKRIGVAGTDMPVAERRSLLEPLAVAGRPYRAMAAEQLAYLLVEEGESEAAVAALNALTTDEDAPSGLRARAAQLVTALGGAPAARATDAGVAPAEDAGGESTGASGETETD